MRPINPYKEIRHKNPSADLVPYECNSVEDYLENKDNHREFPRGNVYGLCALILGAQKLTIQSAEIRSLPNILEKDAYFVWELSRLNEMLLAYNGVTVQVQDAYMQNAKQALLFLPEVEYEKLNRPPAGSNLIQADSLVSYPPLLVGTRLQGFYLINDDPKRKFWVPRKPKSPTRILEQT